MAGQLAVTARKSIPVENRSGRVFMMAGVSAAVIATSQWAHWMGYADWDLLSIIPGFAQVSGLLPNAYADGRNFDCPNKTLGAEIALMSDDMLKTVGKTLCTKEELIAASLRGNSSGRSFWRRGWRWPALSWRTACFPSISPGLSPSASCARSTSSPGTELSPRSRIGEKP